MQSKDKGLEKIKVYDVLSKDIKSTDMDSTVQDAVNIMKKHDMTDLMVKDGGEYIGFFGYKQLFYIYGKDIANMRLSGHIDRLPAIDQDTDMPNACMKMYLNDTRVLPVHSKDDSEEIIGLIDEASMIEHLKDKGFLYGIKAEDIMQEPVTIKHTESIGKAIELMRERSIGRLPVVSDKKGLEGVLDANDMIDSAIASKSHYSQHIFRPPEGEKASVESHSFVGSEMSDRMVMVDSIMHEPVHVCRPTDMIEEFANDGDRTVLVKDPADDRLVGIWTPRDLIRHFARKARTEGLVIWMSGFDDLKKPGPFEVNEIHRMAENTASKLSDMLRVDVFSLHFKSYDPEGRQEKYSMKAHVSTSRGFFVVSSWGWDFIDAFADLMYSLERVVSKRLGKISDSHVTDRRKNMDLT